MRCMQWFSNSDNLNTVTQKLTNLGSYNFPAAQRPVPCTVYLQGYPGKHYCPRMATMNKPCYAAIKSHSPSKPVLILVSSRRQTGLESPVQFFF